MKTIKQTQIPITANAKLTDPIYSGNRENVQVHV